VQRRGEGKGGKECVRADAREGASGRVRGVGGSRGVEGGRNKLRLRGRADFFLR
jgi:hypothetical protein